MMKGFVDGLSRWLQAGRNHGYERAPDPGLPAPSVGAQHETAAKIGDYWGAKFVKKDPFRAHFWESDRVVAHINARICGEPVPGTSAGLVKLLQHRYGARLPFRKGISVGCAAGWKEMILITSGIAATFDLFELSPVLVEEGRRVFAEKGMSERAVFHQQDAFAAVTGEELYDLVYWDNALHHMFDVDAALAWSRRILAPGGVLCLYDFVGPTRSQWSQRTLEIGTRVRHLLQERQLVNPWDPQSKFERSLTRPTIESITSGDPSEMADCGRTLECLRAHFPNAEVINAGGVVYFAALSGVLANIDEKEERPLLDALLLVDDLVTDMGETLYAVALAVKD